MSSPVVPTISMEVDDEVSGEATSVGQCPHVDTAFAVEAARLSMLRKYKSAIAWGASSSGRAAKRRKVRAYLLTV